MNPPDVGRAQPADHARQSAPAPTNRDADQSGRAVPVRYELRPGGYSTADRFAVVLADGRRVFVKSAAAPNLADWLRREQTPSLPIGLFGASTGGGAALMAAARRPQDIVAVVSRGGRPDLAGPALAEVTAPTAPSNRWGRSDLRSRKAGR